MSRPFPSLSVDIPTPTAPGNRRRTKTDGDAIVKKKKRRSTRRGRKTVKASSPSSPTRHNQNTVSEHKVRSTLRRLSVSFMSEEVARMTQTHKSAKKGVSPTSRNRTESDVHVRRTMVHRAIKKLRNEERNKHRNWIATILRKDDKLAAEDPLIYDGLYSDDDNGDTFDADNTSPNDKGLVDVAKRLLVLSGAVKRLKKKAAKPSWYSEYQETNSYEYRVQKDGFEFIFEYSAHFGNTIKSFFPTAVMEVNNVLTGKDFQLAFISLDKTGFNYWETVSDRNNAQVAVNWERPKTVKRVAFKRRQNEFIQSLCYIPKHGMYIGAGLDMLAHMYDKYLNYITSLPTGERVIRHIIYNPNLDEVIIAGSGGCKSWKLERVYSNGTFIFDLKVVRQYTKEAAGESNWVSNVEFDNDSQRLILIADDKVSCINCANGELMSLLQNIHDAPITGCVWYNRSQYFITSCAGGKVKVWAIHHDSAMQFGKHDYALLHVFTGHTKAVTSIQLHPLSGLAVSVSLDGTLRVLNLEALEEIYTLQIMQPLIAMKCVTVNNLSLCIGATIDGKIRVWSINDFLGFFNVCRAKCELAQTIYQHEEHETMMNVVVVAGEDVRVFNQKGGLISNMIPGQLTGYMKRVAYSISHQLLFILHGGRNSVKVSVFDCRHTPCELICHFDDPAAIQENDLATDMVLIHVSKSDMQTEVKSKRASAKNSNPSRVLQNSAPGSGQNGRGRFSSDTHSFSGTGSSAGRKHLDSNASDERSFRNGEGLHEDECLVFGTRSGGLIVVQPSREPQTLATYKDCHEDHVTKIVFVENIGKLVTFGVNSETKYELKVWVFPSMKLSYTLPLRGEPTAIAFSDVYPLCCLGFKDGMVQLIELVGSQPIEVDNPHTLEQHIDEVCSVSFCDELQVYCSSSLDRTIKIWDFGNRLLDRVILNKDPIVCFFNGKSGDVVVGQGNYLLKVNKGTWLPPGGEKALQERQSRDAALKIQARFRGTSIRRVLGTGIQSKELSYIKGDQESNETFLGIDGKFHRRVKKHELLKTVSSMEQNWARKLNRGATKYVTESGNDFKYSGVLHEGGHREDTDEDSDDDDFFNSPFEPTRPEGDDAERKVSHGTLEWRKLMKHRTFTSPRKKTTIDAQIAAGVGEISQGTIESRIDDMMPPLASVAKRYNNSLRVELK